MNGVLKKWAKEGTKSKGLLASADIPALSLSDVDTIVFLSPVLTDLEYLQACGRVIRQGSQAVRRGTPVQVVVLTATGTVEETDVERLRRFEKMARDMSDGLPSCEASSGSSEDAPR